jgi:hypothetical protein
MNPLGYDVYFLNDQIYGKTYLVAEERQTGFRGLGTYTNTGLTSGTRYCYVVAAVNASGQSANSNEACATVR